MYFIFNCQGKNSPTAPTIQPTDKRQELVVVTLSIVRRQKEGRREERERERDHWDWLDWLWTVEWLCTTNYISGAAGLAGLPGLPLAGKVRRHSSAVKWNIISQFFILHWDLRPGALRYKHPLIILNNQDITHDWWECISLHLSMHTKNTTKWNTDVLVKLE